MGRGRQQADFERLTQIFAGAHEVATWVTRLEGLAGREGSALAGSLLRAYRCGALSASRWEALTGRPPASESTIDATVGEFWDAAVAAGLAQPSKLVGVGRNPGAIRRWAWQPRWRLMEQDEDLLLMQDAVMPVLLEIAANREVPKREYILQIVAHHARDSCTQAFYWGRDITGTLLRAATWAPAARSCGCDELAVYLERLGRHAIAGRVDHAAAVQRLRDVARCREPTPEQVAVSKVEGGWEGLLLHSGSQRRLFIDGRTGAVRFAASDTGPAR